MRKKLLTSILVLSMVCSVISEHTAFAASVATLLLSVLTVPKLPTL